MTFTLSSLQPAHATLFTADTTFPSFIAPFFHFFYGSLICRYRRAGRHYAAFVLALLSRLFLRRRLSFLRHYWPPRLQHVCPPRFRRQLAPPLEGPFCYAAIRDAMPLRPLAALPLCAHDVRHFCVWLLKMLMLNMPYAIAFADADACFHAC